MTNPYDIRSNETPLQHLIRLLAAAGEVLTRTQDVDEILDLLVARETIKDRIAALKGA